MVSLASIVLLSALYVSLGMFRRPTKVDASVPLQRPQGDHDPQPQVNVDYPKRNHVESLIEAESKSSLQSVPPHVQQLIDIGEGLVDKLIALDTRTDFEGNGKQNGVELALLSANKMEDEKQVVRGKMNFGPVGRFSHQEIIDIILDLSKKDRWDPDFLKGEVVEDLAHLHGLEDVSLQHCWSAIKCPMGVAPRDFLYELYAKRLDDNRSAIVLSHSEDSRWPEGHFNPKYVRGKLVFGGVLISDEEGYTYVTYFNQVDVGGSIPSWIVNLLQYKQPTILAGILKELEKLKRD